MLSPDRREAHRLLHQHLREVQHVPPSADFAVMPDLPHEGPRGILDCRELRRIRPRRGLIHLAGGLPGQRLMRAFPIIFLHKRREPPLLHRQGRSGRPLQHHAVPRRGPGWVGGPIPAATAATAHDPGGGPGRAPGRAPGASLLGRAQVAAARGAAGADPGAGV